ncbi:hypothetical protein EIP91_006024 [Steccherinum ochraceum]|uniref:Protein kinase domain-containing protein n=1 Tax=Steccherinum ochraceum TaxID=92696 RepID=A0A4R0RH54_9APHY|nr:hypothetical protein EIP91_006024 [Steccherinum ochraceum]
MYDESDCPMTVKSLVEAIQAGTESKKIEKITKHFAQQVLDQVWKELFSSSWLPADRPALRRLIVKIADCYDIFPTSLYLQGVQRKDELCLDEGGFARIFRGTYLQQQVVIKITKPLTSEPTLPKDQLKKICREAIYWRSLTHEYILPFYGLAVGIDPRSISMILPYMRNRSLQLFAPPHLWPKAGSTLDQAESVILVTSWIHQIALGLEYLDSPAVQIVHGDLHPGNVLVTDDGIVRLADFGLAVMPQFTTESSKRSGMWCFRAPELQQLPAPMPTSQSDIYAYGETCKKLLTYNHSPLAVDRDSVASGSVEEPALLWSLIQDCTETDASSRPSACDVVERLNVIAQQLDITSQLPSIKVKVLQRLEHRLHSSSSSLTLSLSGRNAFLDLAVCEAEPSDDGGLGREAVAEVERNAVVVFDNLSSEQKSIVKAEEQTRGGRVVQHVERVKRWWEQLDSHEYREYSEESFRLACAWMSFLLTTKVPKDLTATSNGTTLKTEVSDDPVPIHTDATMLQRALHVAEDEDAQMILLFSDRCKLGSGEPWRSRPDGSSYECPLSCGHHSIDRNAFLNLKEDRRNVDQRHVAGVRRGLIKMLVLMKSMVMVTSRPNWRKLRAGQEQEHLSTCDEVRAGALLLILLEKVFLQIREDFKRLDIPGRLLGSAVWDYHEVHIESLTSEIRSYREWYGMLVLETQESAL